MKTKSVTLLTVLGVPVSLIIYTVIIRGLIMGQDPAIEAIVYSTLTALFIWWRAKPLSSVTQSED